MNCTVHWLSNDAWDRYSMPSMLSEEGQHTYAANLEGGVVQQVAQQGRLPCTGAHRLVSAVRRYNLQLCVQEEQVPAAKRVFRSDSDNLHSQLGGRPLPCIQAVSCWGLGLPGEPSRCEPERARGACLAAGCAVAWGTSSM